MHTSGGQAGVVGGPDAPFVRVGSYIYYHTICPICLLPPPSATTTARIPPPRAGPDPASPLLQLKSTPAPTPSSNTWVQGLCGRGLVSGCARPLKRQQRTLHLPHPSPTSYLLSNPTPMSLACARRPGPIVPPAPARPEGRVWAVQRPPARRRGHTLHCVQARDVQQGASPSRFLFGRACLGRPHFERAGWVGWSG
jgi:hypothetical protein